MILHVITEFYSAPWDVCGGGAAVNVFNLRWPILQEQFYRNKTGIL